MQATPLVFKARRFVPHDITDRGYWNAVAREGRYAAFRDMIETHLRRATPTPPMPWASDFLAARRSNDRARLDNHWRVTRGTFSALAIRRCLLGIETADGAGHETLGPDDRLLDWLFAFLNEATWSVSANLPDMDLPASGKPALDLASCDMAALLAEMRQTLKPWMDTVSRTLADSIITEIDRRILGPYGQGLKVRWDNPDDPRSTNWEGVCAGSILAACEALAAQGLPRPEARRRAIASLRHYVDRAFTRHGECDEGLVYWNYGMGFASMGWGRLSVEELAAAVDMKRLAEVAEYPRRVHLAGDLFYSGNDSPLRGQASLFFVPWLAHAVQSPWLLGWARDQGVSGAWHFSEMLRVLDGIDILTPNAASKIGPPAPAATATLLEDQQVAIMRAATAQGELIACLTGGSNDERHNHNDLGHFVVMLGDKVIVPDLGAPHYTVDFFGPKRYEYLSASSRGHCCPLINGYEQRAGAEAAAKVVTWSAEATGPKLVLDLTAAYPAEAGLRLWTRGLELQKDGDRVRIVIADEFHCQGGTKITHVLWSLEKPRMDQQSQLLLGPVVCKLAQPVEALRIGEVDPRAHRLRQWTDRMLHQIEADYRADDRGVLRVQTVMEVTMG